MDKRTFIKNAAIMLGAVPLLSEKAFVTPEKDVYFDTNDAKKWQKVRKEYKLNNFINLENGYYCITPQPVMQKFYKHAERVNLLGSYYMRNEQVDNKNKARKKLAELVGCSSEELAITRNTTESLDLVIGGFQWQKGDEAIMANQDYGAMLNMFKQVARRHGVVNKYVDVPLDPISDEEIVSIYEKAITEKTKMIMVCHMINITGHILPVQKICDMAHRYGIKVLVDGAHCIAHFDFKISDLNCDYYGASLHKWLSNPLGAGLLYVRKELIPTLWPLLASWDSPVETIQHLNHTGTLPVYTDLAILDSIDYYLGIGKSEKEARLRYLQNYWVDQLRGQNNIILNTPTDKSRSCGIANVGLKNMKPSELSKRLYEQYNIYTVAIDGAGVHGCRITPNVYTTVKELDVFINAMKQLSKV